MRYDLDDLRLFLGIVTEGSITAGARRMHLSLPSASARVRSLEHHAGVALLIRGRRGVRPTPAGTALARHAREVLDRTARLESAVASYARPRTAPLTLLGGGSALHRLVPRALVSFLRAHPDIDVTVSESRTPRTLRLLAAGEADLGVVVDDEARDQGLDTEPLGDDSLVVVGQSGGILAGRTALTYSEGPSTPSSASTPTPRSAAGSRNTSARTPPPPATAPPSPTWALSSPSPPPEWASPSYPAVLWTRTGSRWTCANCGSPGPAATTCWPGAPRPAPHPRRRRPRHWPNTCDRRPAPSRRGASPRQAQKGPRDDLDVRCGRWSPRSAPTSAVCLVSW